MPSLLAVAQAEAPGGAEIGLARLLVRLRARGWRIEEVTPAALPLGGLAPRSGARALRSWPRARRMARGFDVVYLNGGVAGRLLPALTGRRTVLHVHDMVERVPPFWRAASVVLADSQAVAERLRGLRAHVVGCPIEPDPEPVAPPWEPDGRPVVGYVGRIEPRKGVLDLVAAAPSLQEAGVRVVLVGEDPYGGDPEYVQRVRAGAGEHFGWVENAAGLMGALDVLVLPSRQEPFGTVLAEAMNAGTPVVATRVGGLPEVVADGVTGRLVNPGDPGALTQAVLEVLDRRTEMAAAARERARRWHADAYADRVEELIRP